MDSQRQLRWQQIQQRLRDLYEQFSNNFDDAQRRLFLEYLEANELGLAYELLCDALSESQERIAPDIFRVIRDVGLEMEIPPNTWERLTART